MNTVADIDWNKYVSANLKVSILKDGHTFANGKVIKRARSNCGELIGTTHSNPLLDTSVYEVQFEDGAVERCTANIIAEHIYAKTDSDGWTVEKVDEIITHKSDDTAVKMKDNPDGTERKTTKGLETLHPTTEW